ncbi:hypothetical protein U1Q18_048672 [Sarracenia purpurea var. burkii]
MQSKHNNRTVVQQIEDYLNTTKDPQVEIKDSDRDGDKSNGEIPNEIAPTVTAQGYNTRSRVKKALLVNTQ